MTEDVGITKRKAMSPEELRELLDYDPISGKLSWKPRNHYMMKPGYHERWNKKYAWNVAAAHPDKKTGRPQIGIMGKKYPPHRVAWAVFYGKWPEHELDHINGDPSDNRISNLRDVPHSENLKNMKLRYDNQSGAAGVSWDGKRLKWHARIKVNYVSKFIGRFETQEEAVAARKSAEDKYGFHVNHGKR